MCIELLVTDILKNPGGSDKNNPDSVSIINLRAIPIGFNADLNNLIDQEQDIILRSNADTARFTVCFPDCPFTRNGLYQIGLVGLDNACPQPALDKIIVSVFPFLIKYKTVEIESLTSAASIMMVIR